MVGLRSAAGAPPPTGTLRWLEDYGIAHREVGRDQLRGDRHRVVPRRQHDGHPARLVHHEIDSSPGALQAASAVQRADFGVLLDRPDAGLDATAALLDRFPTFTGLQ